MTRRRMPELWRGPTVRPSLADLRRFRDQPHAFLLDMARAHGDVCWIGAGPFRAVLATGPEHIRHVLVEGHRIYRKDTFQYTLLREITGDGLLVSDGDTWRRRRRIQQPAFHPRTLSRVADVTRRQTADACERWRASARIRADLHVDREMFELALGIVLETLFGYRAGTAAPALVAATLEVLEYIVRQSRTIPVVPRRLRSGHRAFRQALRVLDREIDTIIRHRSGGGTDDLLDHLLHADPALTPAAVRNEMMTMIIAGHETVASALTWTWMLLSGHPEADDAVSAEARRTGLDGPDLPDLPTARAAFSEALRLFPPAWMVSRKAVAVDEPGAWLPPGTLVLLSPFVTQRLGRHWPDPDRFDPGRFANGGVPDAYFPFGAGPRQCIGRDFALVEAMIVLATVAGEYRFDPPSSPPAIHAGVTLQPAPGLRLRIHPR